jgi:hypothetical protein
MMNLFAYVTAYPIELDYNCDNAMNDEWLITISGMCKDVVFAWGNFNVYGRDEDIKEMFPKAVCLGINKNGSPKHPLYISSKQQQVNFQ